MWKKLPRVENCLNCGEKTAGDYCACCGQETEDRTASLVPLLSDFVADVASFDSKLIQTLKPLLFSPGALTVAYNEGKRVRYLAPLKLYLFFSLLFFFAVSRIMPPIPAPKAAPAPQTATKPEVAASPSAKSKVSNIKLDGEKFPETEEELLRIQNNPNRKEKIPPIVSEALKRAIRVRQSPKAFLDEFMNNLPRMMFLLLPLFALLLKTLYWRSRRFYTEHLIFSLHCHAFLFLLLTLETLSPWENSVAFFFFITPLYLFFAMRRVYGQSALKTLLKLSALSVSYLFLLTFALLGAGLISLLRF